MQCVPFRQRPFGSCGTLFVVHPGPFRVQETEACHCHGFGCDCSCGEGFGSLRGTGIVSNPLGSSPGCENWMMKSCCSHFYPQTALHEGKSEGSVTFACCGPPSQVQAHARLEVDASRMWASRNSPPLREKAKAPFWKASEACGFGGFRSSRLLCRVPARSPASLSGRWS